MAGVSETLREVVPGLWVSDIDSAAMLGDSVDLVIDCTGRGPCMGQRNCLDMRPEGNTAHIWDMEQLDTIASIATLKMDCGKTVMIHCRRGVSRSAAAAAAVLLWQGKAGSVDRALQMVAVGGKRMSSQTKSSLRRWWDYRAAKQQTRLC